ncbi:MAG: arsenite efflux transporter metallochaperone ArsD [Deferrisomatales bacterium]|nr:arsenite efflux transporter metallochaperone ArsD [Deferrisomatales bacterium]
MSLTLQIFDPPMCCSTGVCGPGVDPVLARFAADLERLQEQGVRVERYNLAQDPGAFAGNDVVKHALSVEGPKCLPLVLVNGKIVSRCSYPTCEQLDRLILGSSGEESGLYSGAVQELVAIGAAIAANCEPCFKQHYGRALKLGVSREDMARAVRTAQMVKNAPAKAMLELAGRYLQEEVAGAAEEEAPKACCGEEPAAGGAPSCCAPAGPASAKPDLAVAPPACDPSTGCCGA